MWVGEGRCQGDGNDEGELIKEKMGELVIVVLKIWWFESLKKSANLGIF